jgi:hypothetical protein
MATLGLATKPNENQELWGLNSKNQHATLMTLPSGGPWRITRVGFFAGGNGSAVTAYGVVWSSGGSVLAKTGALTIPSVGFALGAGSEVSGSISGGYEVDGGTSIYVGFSRNPAEAVHFPTDDTGTHYDATKTGTYPGSLAGATHSGVGRIGAYIEYEAANHLPTAPSLRSPSNGAVLAGPDMTPTVEFDHNDEDGDPINVYDLQVDNNSGFGSPNWEASHATSGIQSGGDKVIRSLSAANWVAGHPIRGTVYYWRARTADDETYGPWSGARTFSINSLPSATKVTPLAGVAANLWNLGEAVVWTDAGAHGKPRFDWTFSDPEGAQAAYRVRVYAAAAGGVPLYDTLEVLSSDTFHDAAWAGVRNQTYYWTIDVKDGRGEWQGESSRTSFLIKWAQAIYQHNTGLGSASWGFVAGAVANGAAAFLFATATGVNGAGRSAWKTSVGALSIGATVAYVNVLVRLRPISTAVAAVSPTLPSMTFTYLATGVNPDRWVLA